MKTWIKLVGMAMVALLLFSACGKSGKIDAEATVKEAFQNLNMAKSGTFDYVVKTVTSVEGQAPGNMNLDLNLGGSFNMKDAKNPLFGIKVKGNLSDDTGQAQGLKGEARLIGETAYFQINTLPQIVALFAPEADTKLINKWWKVDLPEDVMKDIQKFNLFNTSVAESELSESEKKIMDIVKNSKYLSDIKYEGDEGGSMKFSAALNPEEIKTIILDATSMESVKPSPEDIAKLDESLAGFDERFMIWVDEDEKIVKKVQVNFELPVDQEGATGNVKVSFTGSFDDYDKDIKLEVPEGAEKFNAGEVFGQMGEPEMMEKAAGGEKMPAGEKMPTKAVTP